MLPTYMGDLVAFIHQESTVNDLLKAALIHFYTAYLHPWFDGNGKTARLLHLWHLVQQRYSSALFVPLSEYVEKSRRAYYNAYTLAEQNAQSSGVMDATPFLVYFIKLQTKLKKRLLKSADFRRRCSFVLWRVKTIDLRRSVIHRNAHSFSR